MKGKIVGLIAVLSFALSFAISGGGAHAAVSNWQQGVSIQPTSAIDFASGAFQQSIDNAAASGVDHITLIIPVSQSNIYSTDVSVSGRTPTDQSLAAAANYIKGKGMGVGFAIHVNPNDGQWRAMINPSDRAGWFANYSTILNHYGTLAQNLGVGQFVLGTELSSMTDPAVNASNTDYWVSMIQDVRSRYSGVLTYSAQHSYYKSDLMSLGFWPQLDYIGISAYYGLSDEANPSVESVKANWDRWNNEQVSVISQRYSKPVLFTEVGYVSRDYALRDPGSAFTLDTGYNGQIQATGYQALFDYWNNHSYVQGVSLWDWKSDPNAGGVGDRDYTPQNKPAEEVMKQWFVGSGTATPAPTPAPTPTQPAPTEPASYTADVQLSAAPVVGSPVSLTAAVSSSQPVSSAVVDVEIYNSAGQKVHQQFYENESLSSTAKAFSFDWTPPSAGEFTVKVGIFSSGWQSNLYWNDAAHVFTVGSSTPTTEPTPTEPVPTEPTPSEPAPAEPTPTEPTPTEPTEPQPEPTPTAPANLSVWWPGDGVTVSGVQPFKGVVDGYDVSKYKMYWQVDGGQLNEMGEGADPVPHKLSYVDLGFWTWSPSKQYTVKFVAKDLAGNVIAEKSIVITVS